MKCPHCVTAFHEGWAEHGIGQEPATANAFQVRWLTCPQCKKYVVALRQFSPSNQITTSVVYPKATTRPVDPSG